MARFVVHYHFPHKAEEMVHRNGRTGRMGSDGDIYFIRFEGEDLPGFLHLSRQSIFLPLKES
ncbi:MAG: hypothetical protein IPJ54_00135 [Saprospiraceae bacterium]|nr:hypothetical protein [Saprospiraceae bacterium]